MVDATGNPELAAASPHAEAGVPAIRRIAWSAPFFWLRAGLADLRGNLLVSLTYGLLIAGCGVLIVKVAADKAHLITAAISGFFIVAPLLATAFYEISRRRGAGEPCGFIDAFAGWTRNGEQIALFGLALALISIAWERVSAILFALFYGGTTPNLASFYASVFLSGSYDLFVLAYVLIGGLIALGVFALSAIAAPMLLDRRTDAVTAIITSVSAVLRNPGPMLLWAALIVGLTAVGFATLMIGLIAVVPLLGHATWHAYRDLTG